MSLRSPNLRGRLVYIIHPHFTFYNLEPGNVVVPTAVESHIANATHSLCVGAAFRVVRLRAVLFDIKEYKCRRAQDVQERPLLNSHGLLAIY